MNDAPASPDAPATPSTASAASPNRLALIAPLFIYIAVPMTLVCYLIFAVARGLDLNGVDDLARTVLSKGWAQRPFFFTSDTYWLPLPFAARGAVIKLFALAGIESAAAELTAIRLVSMLYLAGIALALARCIVVLGGRGMAVFLFALAFVANFGTFELASSALSEPDYLFWISLALLGFVRFELSERRSPRWFALGVCSLFLAGLCRYEAWAWAALVPLYFNANVEKRFFSKGSEPPARLQASSWALLLTLWVPAIVWIAASAVRHDDPFHFIKQEQSYTGMFGAARSPGLVILTFLKMNPVMTPLMLGSALLWIRRLGLSPAGRVLVGFTGAIAVASLYATWNHQATARFAWPLTILAAVPGSLFAERILADRLRSLALPTVGLLLASWVAMIFWQLPRQSPFVDPVIREFATLVDAAACSDGGDRPGRILLRDHEGEDRQIDLLVFRSLIAGDSLILCEWIDACDGNRDDAIAGGASADEARLARRRALDTTSFVLSRNRPDDLAGLDALKIESPTGWTLWGIGVGGTAVSGVAP